MQLCCMVSHVLLDREILKDVQVTLKPLVLVDKIENTPNSHKKVIYFTF